MSTGNKPILITGCQRSGTTLLNLILDSHPEITGIDEMQFDPGKLSDYLAHEDYHPYVSLKLPTVCHEVNILHNMAPKLKVLWCVRDPRDVVLSMASLMLGLSETERVSWASHPMGASREISNCFPVLNEVSRIDLSLYIQKYRNIEAKPPALRSKEEAIFTGALCWRIKNMLLDSYDKTGINYIIVRFEDLVTSPRTTIDNILKFTGLDWHDDVLKHHRLHSGHSVGNTDNSAPINKHNTRKWTSGLDSNQVSIINNLCSVLAKRFNYTL